LRSRAIEGDAALFQISLNDVADTEGKTVGSLAQGLRHSSKHHRKTPATLVLLTLLHLSAVLFAQQSYSTPARAGLTAGFVSAARFSGPDWLAKVNAAATLLKGGTIEVSDSIAGPATTIGTIPSNVTLEFTGSGTFGFCQINVGQFTKIYNNDALLQMTGSDCAGINQSNSAILQNTDKFILDGVRVDCNQQPNSTGVFVGGGHAQTSMRNVTVANCTTAGLKLDGAQFGEYANVSLYNNFVGLKIYSTPAGGGGNSNTFYGLKVVGSTVGVLIVANSAFGMGGDYFINPSLLENSTAAMAVFGNTWPTDIHWYGGAPEHTGEKKGQRTVTIDGRIVKQASIYANLARVTLSEVSVAEARVTPFIRAENFSEVILNDISGYGNWAGTLISADSSSTTSLEGHINTVGTIQNVISYPPVLRTGGYIRMFGPPLFSSNPDIPNSFTGNSNTPPVADIHGSLSSTTAKDRRMGPVTTVVHAATPGTQESNRVNFGNVVSSQATVPSDILVSILLKASVNCGYVLEGYDDGYTATAVPLEADKWTRVVIFKAKAPAGAGLTLIGWPADSSGPTVSFTRLEVLTSPVGSSDSLGYMGTVLTTGAVNPNGLDRYVTK
jgi:hypothetical protein